MSVINLTTENFEEQVIGEKIPVLVDFWANWCGPCKIMLPVVEKIADEMGESVKICKINVDEQPELASRYNVMSIPTFLLFKNGDEIKRTAGVMSKTELSSFLDV